MLSVVPPYSDVLSDGFLDVLQSWQPTEVIYDRSLIDAVEDAIVDIGITVQEVLKVRWSSHRPSEGLFRQ